MDENAPVSRRIVLCVGQHCNASGEATRFYERLREVLGYPNPFERDCPLNWTTANCIDRCEHGPNLMIYPEARCYHSLDVDTLEEILQTEILPLLERPTA